MFAQGLPAVYYSTDNCDWLQPLENCYLVNVYFAQYSEIWDDVVKLCKFV